MFEVGYRILRPVVYNLQLRPGVKNIRIEFSWDGGGSVNLELVSQKKTYTEGDMKVKDKTSIKSDEVVVCKYTRGYELTIPQLSQEETWLLRLNLENIYKYQLDIEAT